MSSRKRPKIKPLRYFFYQGKLCRKTHIHRPNDIVTAWNYTDGKIDKFVYSDVRKNGEQAFTTLQVSKMIGRSTKTVKLAITDGMIPRPQITYGLDENRNEFAFYWSEADILGLREYLSTVHRGRPRKDGLITPAPLPTVAELRAQIRQGTVFYVKVGDTFVPTWQAENI